VILDQEPARVGERSCPIRSEQVLHVTAVLDGIDYRVGRRVYTEVAGHTLAGSGYLLRVGCIGFERLYSRS
jgi:hypothetical protein